MRFLFAPNDIPALPIEGRDELFPVRRIWCVGRNYHDHAIEMGGRPDREPPFFFGKPADAVAPGGGRLDFPLATGDLHHEVELAVVLRAGGSYLTLAEARSAVFGAAIALDMTRRDLQAEAKRMARPWDMAKGFDQSCPIGAIRPCPGDPPVSGPLTLSVNGDLRQTGDLSAMIWPVAECIAHLSTLVGLAAGDVVLTGTPAGVGRVNPGDRLLASGQAAPDLEVIYTAAC
jgi:fumarylpyruvate hydrolase